MNFEEAGKAIDTELVKLVEFIDKKVKPETKRDTATLLKKAADHLTKLAQSLEKESH